MGSLAPTQHTGTDEFISQRRALLKDLKKNLGNAQARMKFFADRKQKEKEFEVGDRVFLQLQPYRQSSVALRRNVKLVARYFGSYLIIAKLNPVAYKLQQPSSARIHPVFHVSQLKKYVGAQFPVSSQPPLTTEDGQFVIYPEEILGIRTIKRHNAVVVQWRMKWMNLAEEQASWEDGSFIRKQFSEFSPR